MSKTKASIAFYAATFGIALGIPYGVGKYIEHQANNIVQQNAANKLTVTGLNLQACTSDGKTVTLPVHMGGSIEGIEFKPLVLDTFKDTFNKTIHPMKSGDVLQHRGQTSENAAEESFADDLMHAINKLADEGKGRSGDFMFSFSPGSMTVTPGCTIK
jgi:hypothetical protein